MVIHTSDAQMNREPAVRVVYASSMNAIVYVAYDQTADGMRLVGLGVARTIERQRETEHW